MFEKSICDLRRLSHELKRSGGAFYEKKVAPLSWPQGGRGNIVMQCDTAFELGNPAKESVSFLLWTDDATAVRDGVMTCIGPDITDNSEASLPFGRVVILAVKGFTRENCCDRHCELELARYDVNLRGYMMRAASHNMHEWSRISREAIGNGFSLDVLASALIERYRSFDFVMAAEVVFITTSTEHVRLLRSIYDRSIIIIRAMNKMTRELSFDCDSCDYSGVCSDVAALRSIRKNIALKGQTVYEKC